MDAGRSQIGASRAEVINDSRKERKDHDKPGPIRLLGRRTRAGTQRLLLEDQLDVVVRGELIAPLGFGGKDMQRAAEA